MKKNEDNKRESSFNSKAIVKVFKEAVIVSAIAGVVGIIFGLIAGIHILKSFTYSIYIIGIFTLLFAAYNLPKAEGEEDIDLKGRNVIKRRRSKNLRLDYLGFLRSGMVFSIAYILEILLMSYWR